MALCHAVTGNGCRWYCVQLVGHGVGRVGRTTWVSQGKDGPAHHLCDLLQRDLVVSWVLLGQSPREKGEGEVRLTSWAAQAAMTLCSPPMPQDPYSWPLHRASFPSLPYLCIPEGLGPPGWVRSPPGTPSASGLPMYFGLWAWPHRDPGQGTLELRTVSDLSLWLWLGIQPTILRAHGMTGAWRTKAGRRC